VGSGFAGAGVIHWVLYKFGCLRRLLITCELGVRFVMNMISSPWEDDKLWNLTSFLD
jgi:hypothetical protein